MTDLAPIVLFVYNRPWHTERTLEALAANALSDQSILYIYCDGPKDTDTDSSLDAIREVLRIVRKKQWCKEVHVIERQTNVGLATNIIDGVSDIVSKYQKVIVLEDDLVTSKGFLKYMNDALDFYEDNKKVMHISGYMFPHNEELPETFFFNVPLCWGWGTWSDSWELFRNDARFLWEEIRNKKLFTDLDRFGGDHLSSQLAHNISGKLTTWFIKWHASVLLHEGFTLYPGKSLVDNIGFDATGVHNGKIDKFSNTALMDSIRVEEIPVEENTKAAEIIKDFYENLHNPSHSKPRRSTFKKWFKNKIRALFFRIFPDVHRGKQSESRIKKRNTYLGKNTKIYPDARLSNSIIGNYTYIAENSIVNNTIIGKYCSIGPNFMAGWGIHPTNGISTHPMFYSTRKQNGMSLCDKDKIEEVLPIEIGNDVFIGMNVTVLDGVVIGDGAVIGAGAVVSKNIPPYAIAVGNPIKIIKYRFEEDIIKQLLKLKWWNFSDQDLPLIEEHFFNVQLYLEKINKRTN